MPSSAPTPLLTPSGLPPPLGSPPEVTTHYPHSPVFEQSGPFRKALVVDLSSSSDEEGLIPDTSHDEEFARRLFDDLNNDVLKPLGDSKVTILSDSDEEEKVHEETAATSNAAPSSAIRSPAPTASAADADDGPKGMQDDNHDCLASDREIGNSSSGGDEAGSS
jgi:hypothetical protein